MGNKASKEQVFQLTQQNLKNAEMKVLLLSGLPEDQLAVMDVPVGEFKGETVNIHTVVCGDYNPWVQG